MRFVKATRLLKSSSLVGSFEGELWYSSDVAQKTLAFFDGTQNQYVPTKALLASQANGAGASGIGVEQVLTALIGGNVQEVIENIDFRLNALETGLEWEPQVIDFLNDPSTITPSAGDRYIVGTSPVGAFVGHANSIAQYDGSSWVFQDLIAANEGTAVFVQALDKAYFFAGTLTWEVFSSAMVHNALGGLQGGNGTDEFYHLTQAYYNLVNALDQAGVGQGSALIKVDASAALGAFTGSGVGGSLQQVIESLATVSSTATGEGSSLVGADSSAFSSFLSGINNLQNALVKIDSLGSTANGEGASNIFVEDAAGNYVNDDLEAILNEIGTKVNSSSAIIRSNAITLAAGASANFVHGLGNRQVLFMVNGDDGSGNAGEFVGALVEHTTGNELNSLTITADEAGDYFLTVIG